MYDLTPASLRGSWIEVRKLHNEENTIAAREALANRYNEAKTSPVEGTRAAFALLWFVRNPGPIHLLHHTVTVPL
jgi:hypothetical protein